MMVRIYYIFLEQTLDLRASPLMRQLSGTDYNGDKPPHVEGGNADLS